MLLASQHIFSKVIKKERYIFMTKLFIQKLGMFITAVCVLFFYLILHFPLDLQTCTYSRLYIQNDSVLTESLHKLTQRMSTRTKMTTFIPVREEKTQGTILVWKSTASPF